MADTDDDMPILLLDGHNLLYRAFTSLPRSIVGSDGSPINGIYGFIGIILRLMRDTEADRVVVAFDVPEVPTFRHELYPRYQGQRAPLGGEHAADFERQTVIAKSLLPSIGVPALTAPGFEADDIIGTLSGQSDQTIIVSTDRDLLQLVRPGVQVMTPANPPVVTPDAEAVQARIGVLPKGIPTYKSLAGDASDNIPGVAGVGAKTAAGLVNEYGTLEHIYENLEALTPRTAAALASHRDAAFLFRRITTIVTDLDLPLSVAQLPEASFAPDARARAILDTHGL
jgi:DNA polymerase-1